MEESDSIKVSSKKLSSTWNNPNSLGIIVAIIAVVITFILYSLYKKSRTKKNGVLLLGICEAGKTLIFARLVYKKFVQTHTSVKENSGDYLCGTVSLKVVDLPGHERLRSKYFDQFKSCARGLAFVVDSVTIQRDIKDVAEFLYNCLTDDFVINNIPPLLILCNKQSEPTAKSSNVIKMLLEKEMNILRTTQTNRLESTAKTTHKVYLGKEGKDFEFSHLSPMRVEFAECSAVSDQDENDFNLTSLEKWIETLI